MSNTYILRGLVFAAIPFIVTVTELVRDHFVTV